MNVANNLILKLNTVIVNPIIYTAFAVALVVFLWGVRGYIAGADNEEVRSKGSKQILWGIVGMAIMIMAFSIIRVVIQTFGIEKDTKTIQDINSVLR